MRFPDAKGEPEGAPKHMYWWRRRGLNRRSSKYLALKWGAFIVAGSAT